MDPGRQRWRGWLFTLPAREVLLQAIILLGLLVVVYPGVFFRGESVIPGDILLLCHPWSEYAPPGFTQPHNRLMVDILAAFSMYYQTAKGSLQAGEWPLWNPFQFLGTPLMANMQSAVFYPPRLLHMAFGLVFAQNVYVLLKLWLCGMTAFLCGRALGLKTWPSRFLSVAWMLSSYNLTWASWPLTDVAAWLPVVFTGVEFTLQGRYRRGFFATALGGTLLLLAGHPETAFAMALWLGFYFVLRVVAERRWGKGLWAPLAIQSGAWALVLLTCASLLLPFLEYLVNSFTLYARRDGEVQMPLVLGTFVTVWVPRFFGTYGEKNYWGAARFNSHLYAVMYPGMAVWLGMTLLLARGEWRRTQRTRLLCLGFATLLSLLIGYNVPAFAWVNRLPFFRSMLASYHAAGPVFAVPLLAAFGLEHWLSRPRKLRELSWTLVAIVPGLCVVIFMYWFNSSLIATLRMTHYALAQMGLAGTFALLSLISLGVYAIWGRPRLVCALLMGVFAADVLSTSQGMNPTVDPKYVFPQTQLTSYLQGLEKPARVGTGEGNVPPGLMTVYGIEETLGYDGLYPARALNIVKGDEDRPRLTLEQWDNLVRAFSVEYFLNDSRFEPTFPLKKYPERFELLGTFEGLEVYRDRNALPRAYLVGRTQIVDGLEGYMEITRGTDFNPKDVAYLEAPLSVPLPASAPGASPGNAHVARRTYTHVTVDVDAAQRGILVLADAYYPGWRAFVDGRPAPILPVDYVLRGVVVEPGRHRVTYEYFPLTFKVGLSLSVAACLGSIGYILVTFLRRRKLWAVTDAP